MKGDQNMPEERMTEQDTNEFELDQDDDDLEDVSMAMSTQISFRAPSEIQETPQKSEQEVENRHVSQFALVRFMFKIIFSQ